MSAFESSSRAAWLGGRIAIDKKWKLLRRVSNPPPHKSRIYSSEVCTQQRHFPSPVLGPESFLRSKFFLLATVCDTIGIRRRSIKTVERFITRCKTNGIVTVYTDAVIDTRRNMENCFRKRYWSPIIKAMAQDFIFQNKST